MHNLRSKYGHTFACFSLRHEIKHTMQQLVLLLLCEGYKHGNVQEGFLITETCKKVSLSRKRARRLPYHGNLEQGFLIKETCKKVSGSRKHSARFPDHGNLQQGFRITETFSKVSGSRKPSARFPDHGNLQQGFLHSETNITIATKWSTLRSASISTRLRHTHAKTSNKTATSTAVAWASRTASESGYITSPLGRQEYKQVFARPKSTHLPCTTGDADAGELPPFAEHRCTRNVQEASETAYASRHAHGHIKPWQMHNIARPCSCSMCCPWHISSRLLQEAKHTDNIYAQEQVWSSYCLIWAVTKK
jgi:hypothetical protein